MPRKVTIRYASLRSCLVNLPMSMYGPLVGNNVRPQNLAVHLLKPADRDSPAKEAHVGWTGMASASSLAQWNNPTNRKDGVLETVEIDPQFASALGFREGATVEIGLLHDLPVAKSISTEPYSADDWEILELHAEFVENNLLSQVRAVSVDQEIDVWVLGRTRIRFRVVSIDPPAKKKAVLLSTNTEVSIAPKLRNAPKSMKSKASIGTGSPTPSDSPSASKKTQARKSVVLRVLPSRLMTTPDFLSDTDEPTICVSPATFVTVSRQSYPLPPSSTCAVTVRRLSSPTTLDILGSNTPSIVPSLPSSKVLQPKNGQEIVPSAVITEKTKKDECVVVRPVHGIPEKHLVLNGQLTSTNVEDWDLISLSLSEETTSIPLLASFSAQKLTAKLSDISRESYLAGVDTLLDQINSFIVRSFALLGQPAGAPRRASIGVPSLLLCGAPGSGRTSIVKEVAKRLEGDPRTFAYHLYVDMAKLSEERVATIKALFDRWLDIASWHKPSLLVLDNLDRVVGPEVEHADSSRQRQLAEHFISSFAPARGTRGVVMLASCQSQSTLHSLLSSAHIFSERLNLRAPNKDARRDIIARLVEKQISLSDLSQDPVHPLNYVALATQTEGYSATDLRDFIGRAIHQAAIRSLSLGPDPQLHILESDFASAQIDFTPLSLRDVKLQKSEVEWSDIGGLHDTRRILRETLEWPTKYGAIFAKCPIRLRSGLLLYGFPGCGKTLLASAVAKECGLNFISVKGPELLNKYIGASEKSVRDLFERATAAKPCILFFDEFDSIAPKRGHDSTGVTDRVVNQMLTQMDGAEGLDGVYVLAATSRPDLIDSALLRPGRLDKSLLCNMPDVQERAEIINALRRKVTLSSDIDVEKYARLTEGYSGADLQALVYNAHLDAVHVSITDAEHDRAERAQAQDDSTSSALSIASFGGPSETTVLSKAEEVVQQRRMETIMASLRKTSLNESRNILTRKSKPIVLDEHLQRSLQTTRPSVSPEERLRLSLIYRAFVSDRSGELPVPPDAGGIGNRASLG